MATATLCLGKHPPKLDVRTLRMARYLDTATLSAPPRVVDVTAGVAEWPMYANDRLGDCTCAAAGHMIEVWTEEAGEESEPAESAIVAVFEKVKVVGSNGEEGANELDVLNYWQSSGIAGHKIAAFGQLSRGDHRQVKSAIALFSGAYIGLALPISAQQQETWDFTGSYGGDSAPNSWGGHAVNVVGYTDTALTVITWGQKKEMTWRFWDYYCDEAYALLSMDWFEGGKAAPDGFDLATLEQDLKIVTSG